MTERRPGSEEWLGEGVPMAERDFYFAMLDRARGPRGKRDYPIELRCHVCGHLRWEKRLRARFMPYWMWRAYRWTVRLRMVARVMLAGRCPQCRFDEKVRGW